MSKKKTQMSDPMITVMYQKMMLKDPKKSANKIIEQFEKTAFRMRRKEALSIIKNLKRTNKEVTEFVERNKKSDMTPETQARIHKDVLKVARREALAVSIRGVKKGRKAGTVQDMRDRTYKNVDAKEDYVVFYPMV